MGCMARGLYPHLPPGQGSRPRGQRAQTLHPQPRANYSDPPKHHIPALNPVSARQGSQLPLHSGLSPGLTCLPGPLWENKAEETKPPQRSDTTGLTQWQEKGRGPWDVGQGWELRKCKAKIASQ
ncbi:hypothetical protein KIL84_022761 [Mauremys mutica]|uniref:Uncharacterized protein n=1 Tax=Mauremys mutica TaxID=74926 RepID=A0A9D3WNS9_9SAUR|nr:hypothetical protein KIL84_022761 [Mauremys mutica]